MTSYYELKLTQEETVKLAGLLDRPEIVDIVQHAQRDAEMGIPSYLGEVLQKAEVSGWLRVISTTITMCRVCGQSWGYYPYKRTNKKKGEYAGKPDRKSPVYRLGVDFETIFEQVVHFRFEGYQFGVCSQCWDNFAEPFFRGIVGGGLPIDFGSHGELISLFKYQKTLICFECHHEAPVEEYGKLPALMGGHYPGKCPECGARQEILGRQRHEVGHRVVRVGGEVS